MTERLTVWWNRSPASTAHVIVATRASAARSGVTLRAAASHPDGDNPVLGAADVIVGEPDEDRYVEDALERCGATGIDLVIPRYRASDLADAGDRFSAVGARVISSPADVIRLADDKVAAYAAAAGAGVAVPPAEVVRSAAAFRSARDAIAGTGRGVCVRPRTAEGSDGFRVVAERSDDGRLPGQFRGNRQVRVTADDVERALEAGDPEELLVAGLLRGTEWSVDCFAWRGRLVAAVPRRRDRFGTYVMESKPVVEDLAATLIEAWGLHGVVNVQAFDEDGVAHLVEVNPRAAGGLHHSLATGVDLTWEWLWAELTGSPDATTASRVAEGLPCRSMLGGTPIGPGPALRSR